ncbi:hypothetical protein ABPG74_021312 [Tetrahymena malaccensis]
MNKENIETIKSVQSMKQDKKFKSLSPYSIQAMPHKSIDLNGSKKASTVNSPSNSQPQQQQNNPNGILKSSNFTQALNSLSQSSSKANMAGTLQRQFLEQKLKEQQIVNQDPKGQENNQSAKNKKGEFSNIFSSQGATLDTGCGQSNSLNNSQTQFNRTGIKQSSLHVSEGEVTPYKQSQLQKQNSSATIDEHGGSRRFSVFSKSSFCTSSSFLFGTRIFNKTQKSVPRVNMSTIFKNKAALYLDEALINTVDDLLDKGYEIVSAKKQERDILKDQEKAMLEECGNLEKEITPLIQRQIQCSEQISHQVGVQKQYEKEIDSLQDELEELSKQIQNRQTEISNTYDEFTNIIKNMEIENNKIKSDININKACHRQEANNQLLAKKQKESLQEGLSQQLLQLKADFESKRMVQADRLRKMENKQKMYIGILKH